MIRVLIVDDHQVVRQGLRYVLEDEVDIEVVGEANDGNAALEAIARLKPDVVLLDLKMPELDGFGVLEQLQATALRPAVIVLTSYADDDMAIEAVRGGATSYLPKTTAVGRVVEAVHAAARGGSVFDPEIGALLARQVRAGTSSDPLATLSRREREVLVGLSRGQSNREIARTLSLSEETVKTYVSALLAKLGLKDRTQAAIFGLQQGLVPLRKALSDIPESD
jgi:NarL family two-component system response regulator LiaR